METPPNYPADLVEVAYLVDGTAVELRPIRPDDIDRLERLFYRLSPLTVYRRFFAPVQRPTRANLTLLANVDYVNRFALVAVVDDEVVAVARYDRLEEPGEAELAVLVEDAWQHRGLATRLLWRLSAAGRARGITTFVAEVMGENRPMMRLLEILSDELEVDFSAGAYHARIGVAGVRPRP